MQTDFVSVFYPEELMNLHESVRTHFVLQMYNAGYEYEDFLRNKENDMVVAKTLESSRLSLMNVFTEVFKTQFKMNVNRFLVTMKPYYRQGKIENALTIKALNCDCVHVCDSVSQEATIFREIVNSPETVRPMIGRIYFPDGRFVLEEDVTRDPSGRSATGYPSGDRINIPCSKGVSKPKASPTRYEDIYSISEENEPTKKVKKSKKAKKL